jgi:glycine cleavage system transcriptional repressor
MNKTAVFVLGPDGPGIIAAVSQVLFEQGCNLEDVSQSSLQAQFVGIFIATPGAGAGVEQLQRALCERLDPLGLSVQLRPVGPAAAAPAAPTEPYVITTIGPDRPGLVAGITGLLAQYGANITNLKAVSRAKRERQEYVMFYEVDVPAQTDRQAFRTALRARANELGLDVNFQHREIFEQVHRV